MKPASPLPGGFKLLRRAEFEHSPLLAFYEIASPDADTQQELSTDQVRLLIGQLRAFPRPPMLVLTGHDPFRRSDLAELVRQVRGQDLKVAVAPSGTPTVTPKQLAELKAKGLNRLRVNLEGPTAAVHDAAAEAMGGYEQTRRAITDATAAGVPVQVNTTLTRRNVAHVDALADLLAELGVVMWSVSFFVPRTPAEADLRIGGDAIEDVFDALWSHAQHQPYAIKVHDAPHYRRFVQRDLYAHADDAPDPARTAARYGSEWGTNDGKGAIYITAAGEIFPSLALPVPCGRFPTDSLVRVYQDHPLFKALRDEDRVGGKCGCCQFRVLCGGSRARAYALTGDPLAPEPDCLGNFPECRPEA